MPYVTRPRAIGWIEDQISDSDGPLIPDLTVSGPKNVNTGLVNEAGDPIYRMQSPIGFGRDQEFG